MENDLNIPFHLSNIVFRKGLYRKSTNNNKKKIYTHENCFGFKGQKSQNEKLLIYIMDVYRNV